MSKDLRGAVNKVSTGIGDHLWWMCHPGIHPGPVPTQPGHPFLAGCNEQWRCCWERNGKFCVAMGLVTTAADS